MTVESHVLEICWRKAFRTEILRFVAALRRFWLAGLLDIVSGMFACRGVDMTRRAEKKAFFDCVCVVMERSSNRGKAAFRR